MFKHTLSAIAILLVAATVASAQNLREKAKERVYGGVGYAASATTTPQEFKFEQPAGDTLVSNGDFATTNNWTVGTDWAIGSGDATFASSDSSTGTLTQSSISVTSVSAAGVSLGVGPAHAFKLVKSSRKITRNRGVLILKFSLF